MNLCPLVVQLDDRLGRLAERVDDLEGLVGRLRMDIAGGLTLDSLTVGTLEATGRVYTPRVQSKSASLWLGADQADQWELRKAYIKSAYSASQHTFYIYKQDANAVLLLDHPQGTYKAHLQIRGNIDPEAVDFGLAGTHGIWASGDNMYFKDPAAGTKTLSELYTGVTFADAETPSGAIDGTNDTFTLANTPDPPASLILTKNGIVMEEGTGNDYTLSGNTITFQAGQIPQTGDKLLCWYRY